MMSTLDDLFPDGGRRTDGQAAFDDRDSTRRLDELFGDRRADLDTTHRASDRPELVAMVNQAAATASRTDASATPPLPDNRRRGHHIDLLNVALASLAVLALAAAGLVGGMQAANASPADDALRVLTADEKTIESATAGLESARTRVTDEIAEADASAAALPTALKTVRDAPDPADIPPGETEPPADAGTIPIADAKALDAVLAAVDAFRSDLAAIELPAPPREYQRKHIDEVSLTEVASAIDAAQQHLTKLDDATASVRTIRSEVQSRADAFDAQLSAFAATFIPTAKTAVEKHPDAREKTKESLTAAAKAVAAADLKTPDGAAALQAYRVALVDLVADQVYQDRVREEEQRRLDEEQRRRERQQNRPSVPDQGANPNPDPSPSPSPAPTDPPADSGTDTTGSAPAPLD
jgi:hypothetical protein